MASKSITLAELVSRIREVEQQLESLAAALSVNENVQGKANAILREIRSIAAAEYISI